MTHHFITLYYAPNVYNVVIILIILITLDITVIVSMKNLRNCFPMLYEENVSSIVNCATYNYDNQVCVHHCFLIDNTYLIPLECSIIQEAN